LDAIVSLQQQVKDLHPAFAKAYPVAVVTNKTFYVYEQDAASGRYKLVKTAPDTMNIPVGIRAAMPLAFWDNRMACVVTPEAFDDLHGRVLVLHEFVHCYQWETCEMRLKEKLPLFQRAMERKDYMWELQHPFPYTQQAFSDTYGAMLADLADDRAPKSSARSASAADSALGAHRKQLKALLSADDWDYMTWQEWKEGLARHLENRVNERVGEPRNTGGQKTPYSRVTFYFGGEAVIRALSRREPAIERDLERLYRAIAEK
jgi:hypothetical protein